MIHICSLLHTRYNILVTQEQEEFEFEQRKRQREEEAEAKTAKNRAKRQKKKERAKGASNAKEDGTKAAGAADGQASDVPLKKRRLVNGKELTFKRPGDEDDEEEDGDGPGEDIGPQVNNANWARDEEPVAIPAETPKIIIHEED